LFAQDSSPVAAAIRSDADRYAKNLVAAAESMPAAKYGTKPTDQQMSFGDLVHHITLANNMLCGSISGQPAATTGEVTPAAGKDALVGALKQSFAYCRTALGALDDAKLGEEVPFFGGRTVTRAAAILDLAADWGDHYSLVATELRLAGLLPPTAQPSRGNVPK
jgi:uncharacterized damage-inducible protein DinB